jgi:methylase of polypeptide subunit release factors
MEMGYNQAEPIKKMIATSEFKLIEIVNDYSNIERIVVLKLERG